MWFAEYLRIHIGFPNTKNTDSVIAYPIIILLFFTSRTVSFSRNTKVHGWQPST